MSATRWLRRAVTTDAGRSPESRLVLLISVLLLFESSLYSALTPVLPHYARALHASKPAVGLLAAAYSAGLIPGSLLGGWLAKRFGVRRTTLAGLIGFGAAVAAFGFPTDIVALDVLRVVQGVLCGLIWGGGLTWAIAAAPRVRRGAVLGSVFAAAIFGTLLGPLLGTIAVTIGTGPVFAAVGAIALGLAGWARRHPEPARPPGGDESLSTRGQIAVALRSGGLGLGTGLILIEAITIGATNVLLPLRLSRFGAPPVAIGATFVLAAALSTLVAPTVGRLSDRHGSRVPIALGLGATAALLAALVLPRSALPLAIISVVALGGPLTSIMIPSISMMTESAERAGVALLVATTLVNLAYASGETIGAPVAGALSQATSDTIPILLLSVMMLLMLVLVLTARRRHAVPAPRPAAQPSTTGASVTSRATSAA